MFHHCILCSNRSRLSLLSKFAPRGTKESVAVKIWKGSEYLLVVEQLYRRLDWSNMSLALKEPIKPQGYLK